MCYTKSIETFFEEKKTIEIEMQLTMSLQKYVNFRIIYSSYHNKNLIFNNKFMFNPKFTSIQLDF